MNQTSYDMNYTLGDWNFILNSTNELDYGFGTLDITPEYRKHPLEQASEVIYTCGIAINGIFIVVLIGLLIMSHERRILSRMWLLFGIITANLLYSIVCRLHESLSQWPPVTSDVVVCGIVLHLYLCLDFASLLSSVLLAYNIFLRIYAPTTERGFRQLAFWIISEIVCWILGFSVALGIRARYAEIIEITGTKPVCMSQYSPYLNLFYSSVTFLLPYAIVLPVTCCSLPGVIRSKSGNVRHETIELAPKPGGCQFNPEYFGVADVNPKETKSFADNAGESDTQNKKSFLPWVIFNFLNIFLGFAVRLPHNLASQEFFIEPVLRSNNNFEAEMIMWRVFILIDSIYFSFMPLLCLMLAEMRCAIKDKCKL